MTIKTIEGNIILNRYTKQIYRLGKIMKDTVEFLNPITDKLEGLYFKERLKEDRWIELMPRDSCYGEYSHNNDYLSKKPGE